MTATTPELDRAEGERSAGLSRTLVFLATLLAASGAAFSGLSVGTGSKMAVVLPLALGVGLIFAALAMTRFAEFVIVMLVLRASIDLAKLSGSAAGNVATNSAASRGLDPSSILGVIFLLAAGLWLAAQYWTYGRLPGSSLRRALLVFLAACLLSITGSENPGPSLLEGLRITAVVAMFVVLEQLMRRPGAVKRFVAAAFCSSIFPLGYTAVGFLIGRPPAEVVGGYSRISGPFNQANTFSRYLMILIIAGVAVYPQLRGRLRVPMVLMLALSSVFLVLTYTRTALLGTVIGLAVVGFLQSKRVLAGMGIAGLCALLLVPQLGARFEVLTQTDAAPNVESGNTLEWRLNYWSQVLPLSSRNPVTGIGLNMTQYNTPSAKQPHSDFVRAYVETGLIGLAAYLALLVVLVRTGRQAVRRTLAGTFDRGIAVGFLGCAVAFVAVSMAANIMSNVVTLWYLVTFAAAASVVARHPSSPEPLPIARRAWDPARD